MAIDPQKLEAFASKGKKGGGGPPPPEHGEPDGEAGEVEQGFEKYAPLLEALEAHAEEVEQCVDELDGDVLTDHEAEMSPEDEQIMREGYADLPGDLKDVLGGQGAIPPEDCAQIADHLHGEDMVDDPERFEGWLCRLTDMIASGSMGSGDDGEGGDEGGGDGDDGGDEGDEGEDGEAA